MVWLKEMQRKVRLLGKYIDKGLVDKYSSNPKAVKDFYRQLKADYIDNNGEGVDDDLMKEDYEYLMEALKEIEEKKR